MERLSLLLLYLVILLIAWDTAFGKSKRGRPRRPEPSNFTSLTTKINSSSNRLIGGDLAYINSLCFGMESNYGVSFYGFNTYFQLLNFSPECFVGPAYEVADTANVPPTVVSYPWFSAMCPRTVCDLNFHSEKIILNSNPYYDPNDNNHDISIFKTKGSVYNHGCGSQPLQPAWISCDKDGPPENYTDCYIASFGNIKKEAYLSTPEILPNKVQAKVLNGRQCQAASQQTADVEYDPINEICATGLDGVTPLCVYDDPFMFCKYWNNNVGHSDGWGPNTGWRSNDNQQPPRNGNKGPGGWGSETHPHQERQNLLAVGHYQDFWGSSPDNCGGVPGVDIYLKYGSPSYRDLFSKCGYYCSDSLGPGYRCKGNPPKWLGPVYCFPEKIPEKNHSHGWTPQSNGKN